MADVKHSVFESSLLRATRAGHILNLEAISDCDNGTVWAKGDKATTPFSREVYKAKAVTAKDPVYVIGSVPVLPRAVTKAEKDETNFYNVTGSTMRAYALERDDQFVVSESLIKPLSSNVVVGNSVIADASKAGYYEEKTPAGEGSVAFIATIREVIKVGHGKDAYNKVRLEVVKNA